MIMMVMMMEVVTVGMVEEDGGCIFEVVEAKT